MSEEAYKSLNNNYGAYARVLGWEPSAGTKTISNIVSEDAEVGMIDMSGYYEDKLPNYKPGSGTELEGMAEGWKKETLCKGSGLEDAQALVRVAEKFVPDGGWDTFEANSCRFNMGDPDGVMIGVTTMYRAGNSFINTAYNWYIYLHSSFELTSKPLIIYPVITLKSDVSMTYEDQSWKMEV